MSFERLCANQLAKRFAGDQRSFARRSRRPRGLSLLLQYGSCLPAESDHCIWLIIVSNTQGWWSVLCSLVVWSDAIHIYASRSILLWAGLDTAGMSSEAPGRCCCCSSHATNHNQQRTSQPRCRGRCVWPGPLSVGNCFVVFSLLPSFPLHCILVVGPWSNSGRCVYLYDPDSEDVFHLICPVKAYPGNQTLSVAFAFLGSLLSLQPGEFTRTELHSLAVVWRC